MAIRYKINVLAALKEAGYSSTRIREEKLIGQSYLQQIRKGEIVSTACLEKLCELLQCQPGDILEYIPEDEARDNA
jgi:putative transcriptional regulator